MKIECTKEKLKEALFLIEKITTRNSSLPILSCVLVDVKGKKVVIKATNLDLGIEVEVPAKVIKEGTVAVPCNILYSFISNLSSDSSLVVEEKDNVIHVSSSQNETTLKTYDIGEFPNIPKISSDSLFVADSSRVVSGLKSVWYSSSVSNIKPELSSVYVYPEGQKVVFVATDSFRLAEKKVDVKNEKKFPPLLIPFKNVPEIVKVLESRGGEVEVHIETNQIAFLLDGVYLVSRVIEGNFPDYKQIIPKEGVTEMIVLKEDILSSLKTANVFLDNFNQVNFSIDPSGGICQIKTKSNEVGESLNKVEASLSGEKININFNYKYINEGLSYVPTDSIVFSFSGEGKPVVVRGVSDSSFTYLVMPMNK